MSEAPEVTRCPKCRSTARIVWDVVSYPVGQYWEHTGPETILATHDTANEAIEDQCNHGTESKHVPGRFTKSPYVKVSYRARYVHDDDTVTALQDKVARMEAALEIVAEGDPNDYTDNYLIARNALRRIALDTTTSTCDNTREGE